MCVPENWLDKLKESPQFIKTTLLDVKRATSLITQKVDKIAQEQKQQVGEEQEAAPKEKIFYSSVAYLQYTMIRRGWTPSGTKATTRGC